MNMKTDFEFVTRLKARWGSRSYRKEHRVLRKHLSQPRFSRIQHALGMISSGSSGREGGQRAVPLTGRGARGVAALCLVVAASVIFTGCFEKKPVSNELPPASSSAVVSPPLAPRGLKAIAASATEVILEWEPPTTGVTHLSIERRGGANMDFVTVVEKLPAEEVDYLDEVKPDTEYVYRVFAWAGELRSDQPAGPVTVKTPPLPPSRRRGFVLKPRGRVE